MSAEETSSSRCHPSLAASSTWRSSSTRRTEPKPQLPQRPRRVQQIEMRGQRRHANRPRHREAILQQRPVKRFPIERDQHGTLRQARRQFLQQRVLLRKIAQEELLHLQAAGIPPRESHKKRVGARAAGQPGGFRIQEKPLFWVLHRRPRPPRNGLIARAVLCSGRSAGALASGRLLSTDPAPLRDGSENSGVENQFRMARCSP